MKNEEVNGNYTKVPQATSWHRCSLNDVLSVSLRLFQVLLRTLWNPPPFFKAKSDFSFFSFLFPQFVFPYSSVWTVNLALHVFVLPAIHINL